MTHRSDIPKTPPECRNHQRGAVLVIVLVTLLALSSLMMRDSGMAFRKAHEARYLVAEYQADLVAQSALEYARLLIMTDDETKFDIPEDDWAKPVQAGVFTLTITPCNARLNINRIPEFEAIDKGLRTLVEDRKDDESLVDYLADWVDGDTSARLPGSESNEYTSRYPSYSPRNGDVETPEEVLLVSGWEDYDPEWLRSHLTSWGKKNININFVSEDTFKAYLPDFSDYWDKIRRWRESSGFRQKDSDIVAAVPELADDPDKLKELVDSVSVNSDFFRIIVEVRQPFVYEKRRYIVERNPILPSRPPAVVRADVLAVVPEEVKP